VKDRFASGNQRQRMRRSGAEFVDGQIPRELWQPPRRSEPSKSELRAMAEQAFKNTAHIKIQRIKSKRGAP
jgi:hypothetical protein